MSDGNENGAKNKRKWCFCQSKNFSAKSDNVRHLKIFRVISNEMPISVLIPCWWYFSCLLMYLKRNLDSYFNELKMFFQMFLSKGDTKSVWEITAYEQ